MHHYLNNFITSVFITILIDKVRARACANYVILLRYKCKTKLFLCWSAAINCNFNKQNKAFFCFSTVSITNIYQYVTHYSYCNVKLGMYIKADITRCFFPCMFSCLAPVHGAAHARKQGTVTDCRSHDAGCRDW